VRRPVLEQGAIVNRITFRVLSKGQYTIGRPPATGDRGSFEILRRKNFEKAVNHQQEPAELKELRVATRPSLFMGLFDSTYYGAHVPRACADPLANLFNSGVFACETRSVL